MTDPPFDFAPDRAAVDAALHALAEREAGALPGPVGAAVRYSLEGGGKRLRAVLFLAAYRAAGGTRDAADLAAAVEVVHAYSLVHDDLPCMDDDDMRRGRPTVHRVFGVGVATAAGVAMVPLAARAAMRAARGMGLSPPEAARIVEELMRASGAGGMMGGQLLDLEGEDRRHSLAELERIHRAKTGALIAAAVALGGMVGRRRRRAPGRPGTVRRVRGPGVPDRRRRARRHGHHRSARQDGGQGRGATGKPPTRRCWGSTARWPRPTPSWPRGAPGWRAQALLSPGLEGLARFIIARRS